MSERVHSGSRTHITGTDRRGARLGLSLALTTGLVVVEAVSGVMAGSLALLTDAAHNMTDVGALALTWFAFRLQSRPSSSKSTYGYHRVGIMAAMLNSAGLMLMSVLVLLEAYKRFHARPEVQAVPLIVVGALAVGINLVTALVIRPASKSDLNMQAAFLHLMADVGSTGAAVAAGIGILLTNSTWLDPVAGAIIAILILVSAWGVLRDAVGILLEQTPRDVDMQALVRDLLGIPGVFGVHDLHVWSLSMNVRTMSAHVVTDKAGMASANRIRQKISAALSTGYNIRHATLQLECEGCEGGFLYCDIEDSAEVHQGTP